MTVIGAIRMADGLKNNDYSMEMKIAWVNEIEGKVRMEIMHEKTFVPFALPDDEDAQLAAPVPYDKLYRYYLCAMIDYANGEYDKYQNSMAMFNESYGDFWRHYIKTAHADRVENAIRW